MHNLFDMLADAAHLRQMAFSHAALLSGYPSRADEPALRRIIQEEVPLVAEALGALERDRARWLPSCGSSADWDGFFAHARREYTSVFYVRHILRPYGSVYRGMGEEAAVGRWLQRLGLKRGGGFSEPLDHISCEADVLAYCSRAEEDAWRGMDAMSASEWRDMGQEFWTDHAEEFFWRFGEDLAAVSFDPYFTVWSRCLLVLARSNPFAHE